MELDPVPPRSVAIPILSRRLVEPDVVAFVQIMIGSLISLAALVGIVLGARVLWRIGSRPATQAAGSSATREELQRFLGHASIRTTEQSYGWLTEQSAATLARARIYGEGLRVVRGSKRHEKRHKAS